MYAARVEGCPSLFCYVFIIADGFLERFSPHEEPTRVDLHVDGVNDICTREQDINFAFTGFSISGAVSTSESCIHTFIFIFSLQASIDVHPYCRLYVLALKNST